MYRRRQKSENCTGQDEDEELKEIKKGITINYLLR